MRVKLRRSKAAALSLLLAVPLAGCPGEPAEELEHGIVWLQLLRGMSEADSPYAGTAEIVVTLLYLECLTSFYMANPNYAQQGVDGSTIFGTREDGGEGWLDRLCETDNPAQVDCTVNRFTQELDSARQLTVRYAVSGDVENGELPFGPIPDADLAACEAGGQPIVRVSGSGSVRGLDGSGGTVWTTESFGEGQAATGQGAPIKIRAARN